MFLNQSCGQRGRVPTLRPGTGAPLHLRGAQLTKKIEHTVQPIIDMGLHSRLRRVH